MAREVAEREAELEDHVLASARPEVPAFRDERADVVTGEQDDGERHAGIRLELLHERSAVGRLLVEQDRLEVELHEKARNHLLGSHVPPVDDQHRSLRRFRSGGTGAEHGRRIAQTLGDRLELAELRPQTVEQAASACRTSRERQPVPRPKIRLEDVVAGEQEPEQMLIVVVPGVVLVLRALPTLPRELPDESAALPDLIEDENRVDSRPREARTKRRT